MLPGGKVTKAGKSVRAEKQASKWNREAGQPGRYTTEIKKELPAGPVARQEILKWEAQNAERLRLEGHLTNATKHERP